MNPQFSGVWSITRVGNAMSKKPCMAIVLINPREPNAAASYHWCKLDNHVKGMHECYCGIWWLSGDMVEPTAEMVKWRTGTESEMRGVSTRLLGYTEQAA